MQINCLRYLIKLASFDAIVAYFLHERYDWHVKLSPAISGIPNLINK